MECALKEYAERGYLVTLHFGVQEFLARYSYHLSGVSPEVCTPNALRTLGQSPISEPRASLRTSHSDGLDSLALSATARDYLQEPEQTREGKRIGGKPSAIRFTSRLELPIQKLEN